MILCGLDQALRKSGAAVLDGQTFIRAEAFTAKGETHAEIFHSFRQWWWAFLVANNVERVAIEEPLQSSLERTVIEVDTQAQAFGQAVRKVKRPMTSMATLMGLYGTRAHAIEICAALNIPHCEVNNQAWRGLIHGRRQAPKGTKDSSAWWKQQALTRCQQLGWSVPSKDAAEAALIAEWLRIELRIGALPSAGLFATSNAA